jgi:sulfite exporter TauE/SafE
MGIGTSIFLIAVGAILKFAVTASVSGIQLATVGVILMVVGIIGLVISLFFWTRATEPRRTTTVVRDRRVDPYV